MGRYPTVVFGCKLMYVGYNDHHDKGGKEKTKPATKIRPEIS
ncbi:MAG: hypothetical protein Q8Q15_02185 [bacterium]|nr:hypothetical protein [bacterium]